MNKPLEGGVDVQAGRQKRRKKGDRKVGILRRMLRVLSGVARGSHSGSTQGQARMAAPGGPGNGPGQALAVQQGQYSHAGAIAILTREIPLEDVSRLD